MYLDRLSGGRFDGESGEGVRGLDFGSADSAKIGSAVAPVEEPAADPVIAGSDSITAEMAAFAEAARGGCCRLGGRLPPL